MKYVAITFDDGRVDNYTVAAGILEKYRLNATLYATTGYIDRTWEPPLEWKYAGEAVSVEQLLALQKAGWEIGLHGDRHVTELEDWRNALSKLRAWGITTDRIGCSLPNSQVDSAEIQHIVNSLGSHQIAYIRKGRAIRTRTPVNASLYLLYTKLGMQKAYNRFNIRNLNDPADMDQNALVSVVVRNDDRADIILKFLEWMPDNQFCILMLHSILEETHPNYGKDPWNWSRQQFEALCRGLEKLQGQAQYKVDTCGAIVRQIGK